MQTQASIDIDRSPDTVFPYLTSPEKQKQWMNGWKNSTQSPVGPIQVGDQFQVTFGTGGGARATNAEILAYQPNHYFKLRIVDPMYYADFGFTVEPMSGGSRVTYDVETAQTSPMLTLFTNLFNWLLTPLTRRSLSRDLKKLKKLVEREN